MSTQAKAEEKKPKKPALPLVAIEHVLAVVGAILAKGGSCTPSEIVAATGKGDSVVKPTLSALAALRLVSQVGDSWNLNELGSKFAAAAESEMKKLMRGIVIAYDPYHTVLLRIKNAADSSLEKRDITKAWFDLYKTGAGETREKYTAAFASICEWCGLVEASKLNVKITNEARELLEGPIPVVTPPPPSPPEPVKLPQGEKEAMKGIPLQPTTTVAINITVDTKDETSVWNLFRIIRFLKGEIELPEEPKE